MAKSEIKNTIDRFLFGEKSIAPLLTFRVLFGLLMFFASLRYFFNGWIHKLFVEPDFHFKYFGFHWVENPGETGIYLLFAIKAISALAIAIGFFFRGAVLAFIFSFAWTELIDASNYLNHHYLVMLFAVLLLFAPANKAASLDVYLGRTTKVTRIHAWCLHAIMVQISIVYFFAGWAKLSTDWLVHGMPLRIWLPQYADWALVGGLFSLPVTALIFSWFGAVYDLSIWAFLWFKKTRSIAYLFVVLFHGMTGVLFNIGIFPWVMILSNLIFFSAEKHEKFWSSFTDIIPVKQFKVRHASKAWVVALLVFYLGVQFLLPIRHVFYPGKVWWTEEGYRFSWRVMLLEKFGQANFYIKDQSTGQQFEVENRKYLTEFQEKQMAIQSDFILQYAQHLKTQFEKKLGLSNPEIRADVFVAVNSRPGKRYISGEVNLAEQTESWKHKEWIKSKAF